jgi:hypothetical protein
MLAAADLRSYETRPMEMYSVNCTIVHSFRIAAAVVHPCSLCILQYPIACIHTAGRATAPHIVCAL